MKHYKIIMCFFFTFITSCSSNKNEITLKDWIHDNNIYLEYITNDISDCNVIQTVYDSLTLDEFKIKLFGDLANCSFEDKEKLRKYLIEDVSSGLHPERIDTIKYSSVFPSIKKQLEIEHKNFWQKIDTSYFLNLEKRVFLDQDLYRKSLSDSTNVSNKKRLSVFKENTKYLLDYCKEHGFPFKPGPRNFNSFRTGINPTVIAIHADYKDKAELLDYAIESAQKGLISWNEPITICITFHTNAIKREAVKPLFFLYFNEEASLDLDKSYLQLYSIAKLYNRDMKVPIKIQPSKFNTDKTLIISKQLKEIKMILVKEFSYNSEDIVISDTPSDEEFDQTDFNNYKFTLTEIIQN